MNKLLLLATSLISLTIQSKGATHLPVSVANVQRATNSDSTIKANPKAGFKNLFEDESVEGINMARLNPKAISFVEDYIDDNANRLNRMKSWGKPYFDMIGDVFSRHNLPVQLKYLSVIESDLKSSAVSWAGAVGPWQLMPATARLLGLTVNKRKDERRDYAKSTKAAAKYLSELYDIYNDWLLVIAAYNCGPGNVNSAIRKSGSRNFWDMQYNLPTETRNHVKKFIATHYIMEGNGGITTLTRRETDRMTPVSNTSVDASLPMLNITGRYTALAIVNVLQMNMGEFSSLNPNFDQVLSSKGSYELRLPQEKMDAFQSSRSQILEQSVRQMLAGSAR